mgnify:CR=1 FL=1
MSNEDRIYKKLLFEFRNFLKIGKHKFIFATIASIVGMKIYQYFKNDADNQDKANSDVEDEVKKLEHDDKKDTE